MSQTRGWGWPGNSKKAHYFVDGMSLCRKWMYLGEVQNEKAEMPGPDDCKRCRLLFEAAVQREAKALEKAKT